MLSQNVTKLFPRAIEATEKYLMKDNKVVSEFDGYAAAIGAAIRISGLIPTLAFYTDAKENGDTERYKLLKAIAYIIPDIAEVQDTGEGHKRQLLTTVVDSVFDTNVAARPVRNNQLGNMPDPDEDKLNAWTKKILEASVALKLCMRNYPHTDDEPDQTEEE